MAQAANPFAMLESVSRAVQERSMRELAYVHIQKKIATRQLRAGAPVSELPIANELGISRTPTREAIRQLVAEGLLEEVPGRGVVVVTLDRRDLMEVYEVRRALEVRAAETAAIRLTTSEISALREITAAIEELAKELRAASRQRLDELQMKRFEAADTGFHTYLLQAVGNRRSLRLVISMRGLIRIFAMRRSGYSAEELEQIHADHTAILDAIAARDPHRAAAATTAHIEGSERTRLEQFDQREMEATLPKDIPAYLERIRLELS